MTTPHLLIRGARLLLPDANDFERADLRVAFGQIAEIGDDLPARDGERIAEAEGAFVSPGWMDLMADLGEPGHEHRETIASGAAAAAAGGYTALLLDPGTDPPLHTRDAVEYVRLRAQGELVDVLPTGCLTKEREGRELAEMADLVRGGAAAFSDGDRYLRDAGLMRRALEYARMIGKTVVVHPEDPSLARGGLMHEGAAATRAGALGIPAVAEEAAIARDLLLAAYTGARVHFAHVTTGNGLKLVREAQAQGVPVTASVSPLHLAFADTDIEASGYDATLKLRPPLRADADHQAITTALGDGTISAFLSGHRPYAAFETEVEFAAAPFGVAALETAFATICAALVAPGTVPLGRAVRLLFEGPRRILGIDVPRLAVGAPADLTLFDPERVWTCTPQTLRTASRHTPFLGRELRGRALGVYRAGQWIGADGETDS
jgi:dihydroorotase